MTQINKKYSSLNYIFLLLTLGMFSSCGGFYKPITMDVEVPDGPENYQAGWYAGCRSAIASLPNYANSMAYDVTFANGQYQDDPIFQAAWTSAFFSCGIHTGTFRGFGGEKSIKSVFE
tara:strand:- start:793 stop:1146 length:354 start_codon:yes stop_codon:yes gene_type:complete